VLNSKSGISKIYFVELPKDVQERFHNDSANAAQFNAAVQAEATPSNAAVAQIPTATPEQPKGSDAVPDRE
jgi:hypothetical protein